MLHEQQRQQFALHQTYHTKKVDEHVGVLAQDVVALAALVAEGLEVPRVAAAHHVRKVGREHEGRLFPLDPQLLLVVSQEVPKVDICSCGGACACACDLDVSRLLGALGCESGW